ncbi:MAG TPA: hypothetical protein VM755_06940 [Stellaceae bacterium]|nr:hypothetical protein [Stellaceae bacterium]
MDSAIPPREIETEDNRRDLRAHYEAVAQDTLRLLWLKRRLIAKCIAASVAVALIALAHMGPRYTGEALFELDFDHGQPADGKNRPAMVTVDAIGVIKSTARVIGSRAIADAVVDRLGLDKNPSFDRRSLSSRAMSLVRWVLGLQPTTPTARGIAADALMKRIQVVTGERAYVIAIEATAGDPRTAATLANAVAAEYWRARTLHELTAARNDARHNLTQIGLVYGPRLPNYQAAQVRLRELDSQMRAVRAASIPQVIEAAAGHWLIPAQPVAQPSGPNIPVVLFIAVVIGFAVGAGFVRYGIELPWPANGSLSRLSLLLQRRLPAYGLLGQLRQRLPARPRMMPRPFTATPAWLAAYWRRRVADWKEPKLDRPAAREEARFD